VTTTGRALEIVTIGLGQAGGNLAAEFARRGYRGLAFNTAATDLSALSTTGLLLPEEQRCYIGMDGHDGAGSDANYGRQCIVANAAEIRERAAAHAAGADVVMITCGLGGGTGSSVAELVKVLDNLSLPLIVLATLPSDHESGIAKVNAVRAVNELVKEPALGFIFIDNGRLSEVHGNVSLDRYYAEINKVIGESLDSLNHLNDRPGVTPIRTLDGEDLRKLLLSSGLLNFGSRQLSKLTTETVIDAVRECVQFSTVMPQGYMLETVSYLGLVLEAPESILATTPFSFFEKIGDQLKDETEGGAIYLGVYRNDNAQHATVRLVCASQSLPAGIREMVTAAKREGAQLRDKLQQTLTGLDLGEIEEYDLFRSSPGSVRRPRIPEQTAASSRRPAPRASTVPVAPSQPAPSMKPAAQPASTAPKSLHVPGASQTSIAPPHSTAPADRESYDQLVREYKSSESDDVRSRVLSRLETDRLSENSLVRYYAVRAMAKLDPSLFTDALQAATEDEDATVRAIAAKALQQQQRV
jgi:cell division GTPase FtsZ